MEGKGVVIFFNLSPNCSYNLKCGLKTRSPMNRLFHYNVTSLFAGFMQGDCWRADVLSFVIFLQLSLFQEVIIAGKNCRAGLPCSLGDNNCCRVSLIEQMEIDLNFSTCALHWLAGSQFWSRGHVGILTSDVHELICPAKISDQACKWAECKAVLFFFFHWLHTYINSTCTWLGAHFCICLWFSMGHLHAARGT